MKRHLDRFSPLLFAAALLLCASFAHSQVPVALAPDVYPIYFGSLGPNAGIPLANGFLYTYQAGTTTLLATYIDSTGTIQNQDPIPLDAIGAPSNGSTETGIWLANTSYKFCAFSATLVQQWCRDNITGYLGLLNLANVWSLQQTFSLPIVDTVTDSQMIFGAPGNQTTLDLPPPTGNVTLHLPNTADTLVGRNTTDTLTNKTLTNASLMTPTINNCPLTTTAGGIPTCFSLQNSGSPGTTLNTLTKLVNTGGVGAVSIVALTDTGGSVGITASGAGTSGSAVVVTSGPTACIFDGPTMGGDYVQISSTVLGNCHDVGATYPITGGQIIGRVMVTNGVGGLVAIDLFPAEILPATVRAVCTDGSTTTVNANTTTQQIMKTCGLLAGALNAVGKAIRLRFQAVITPGGAGPPTSNFSFGIGTSSALGNFQTVASQGASASAWNAVVDYECIVTTAGAGGVLSCVPNANTTGGSSLGSVSMFFPSLNLTGTVFVGESCSFSAGSTSNTCVGNFLTVEQLN